MLDNLDNNKPGEIKGDPKKSNRLSYARLDSPVGSILLVGDRQGLRTVELVGDRSMAEALESLRRDFPEHEWVRDPALLREALAQLQDYFAGWLPRFTLRLAPRGTDFQKRIWQGLTRIPFGKTRTYGQIAQAVGRPQAARAVGQACHRNPLAIVIPCHRVVGADGGLTGYACGLDIKQILLDLERRHASQ